MYVIQFEFPDVATIDATLLAALGELPAKHSFMLIRSVHEQVTRQDAAAAAAAKTAADNAAELAKLKSSAADPEPEFE